MKANRFLSLSLVFIMLFTFNQFAQTDNEVNIKAGDGTNLVKVKESGNVGIGIDDPIEKLEVDGNVKANNILSVATFSALLTNQIDFTSSSSQFPVVLKYTDVQQNTNLDVFEVTTGGTLRIKKEGHLSIVASLACEGIGYGQLYTNLGSQVIIGKWINHVAGKITFLETSFNVKVSASAVISITSVPLNISDIGGNNLKFSILSVQWIGVDN